MSTTPGGKSRHLAFYPTGDVDERVLGCEADVFGHYYGNSPSELEEAYGPYRQQAAFLAVWVDDEVIGTCRLIRPGSMRLKTVVDLGSSPWTVDVARCVAAAGVDEDRAWDVATLAVRPKAGAVGKLAAAALFHGLVQISVANQVDWMVAVLDHRARSRMAARGLEVHAFPGTRPAPYLGSRASTPVFAHMRRLMMRQREVNPEGYRTLMFGEGLDGLTVPGLQQYLVTGQSKVVTQGSIALPEDNRLRRQ